MTINGAACLLYFLAMARLVERLGTTDWGRLFVMAAAVFGTFVTTFAVVINNHLVGAACTAVRPGRRGADRAPRRAPAAVVSRGRAGRRVVGGRRIARPGPAASLSLALFGRPRGRRSWATAPPLLLVAIVLLGTNWIAHHSLRPPYMHRGPGDNWYDYTFERGGRVIESYWNRPPGVDHGEASVARYAFHVLVGHHGDFLAHAGLADEHLRHDLVAPSRRAAATALGGRGGRGVAGLRGILFCSVPWRSELRRHDHGFSLGLLDGPPVAGRHAAHRRRHSHASAATGAGAALAGRLGPLGPIRKLEPVEQPLDCRLFGCFFKLKYSRRPGWAIFGPCLVLLARGGGPCGSVPHDAGLRRNGRVGRRRRGGSRIRRGRPARQTARPSCRSASTRCAVRPCWTSTFISSRTRTSSSRSTAPAITRWRTVISSAFAARGVRTLYIQAGDVAGYQNYLQEHVFRNERLSPIRRYNVLREASRAIFVQALEGGDGDETVAVSNALGRQVVETICRPDVALMDLLPVMGRLRRLHPRHERGGVLPGLAQALGIRDTEALVEIGQGALLHDYGKRGGPATAGRRAAP